MTINIYFLPHWFATINITYLPYHCIFSPLNTLKMLHIYLTFQIHDMHVWTMARELLVHQYLWHDAILNDFNCLYVSFVWTLATYFKDTGFFGRPRTEVYRVIWSLVITPFSNSKLKLSTFSSLSRAYFQNYTQKHLWGKQGWFGLSMDWQYHQRGNVMWRKSSNGVLPG